VSQTVADLLVGVLEQIGVKHIFALIGDSLNPLADAFDEATSSGLASVMRKERRYQRSPGHRCRRPR
jgi:thiamine pyrophosphate-dependent acetolactate synthase large subunit-like protein